MTIPESFGGSSRKPKQMNATEKKTPRKTKIVLNIPQGQKTMVTKRWL